ncbi:MAG: hypothetical protein ACYS8I_04285 [Planctomycetota bacterium]|jgi:hypothetical protein
MGAEKEKIDLVLEERAEEQLAKVDWETLNAAISSRLDEADGKRTFSRRFTTVFKIGAGVAAAAAIVFVAVMVKTEKSGEMGAKDGGYAVVEFVEAKGSASVEILDQNGEGKEDGRRAAWIMIRMPEPALADNGTNGDLRDLIRLF